MRAPGRHGTDRLSTGILARRGGFVTLAGGPDGWRLVEKAMMIQATMIVLVATVPLAVGDDATVRVDTRGHRAAAPR